MVTETEIYPPSDIIHLSMAISFTFQWRYHAYLRVGSGSFTHSSLDKHLVITSGHSAVTKECIRSTLKES